MRLRAVSNRRSLLRASRVALVSVALLGVTGSSVAAVGGAKYVGRTLDGTSMAALSIEGQDVLVYVIDTATVRPVLRGRIVGRTFNLSGKGIKAQGSVSGAGAVLTLVSGSKTQRVRLTTTTPGNAFLRTRSRAGTAEAVAIISDYAVRVSVTASTTTRSSPAPTLKSVVVASREVAFPDSILRRLELERDNRELLCDMLRVELANLEFKRLIEKLVEISAEVQKARRALETAIRVELEAAGGSAALISARHAEIREVVASIERAAKAKIKADTNARISDIKERAEQLGCTLF